MNAGRKQALWVLLGMLIVFGAASPAQAQDVELFVADGDPSVTGAQPNILFIIDNSGSMGANVTTQVDWDAATTFSGCYDSDAVYFSSNGSKPGCSSDSYVWKTSNFCDASKGPLAGIGQYSDNLRAWRSNRDRWVPLNGNRKNREMECEDDRGIHGQNAGDAAVWASSSSSGPWTTNLSNEPRWNRNYTLYDGNWLNWDATGGSITQTRLEIAQQVVVNLLDNIDGVNVGLQQFNVTQGGPISYAMEDIATARAGIQAAVQALNPDTWTPLSETLYEAGQYFAGRDVDFGDVGDVDNVVSVAGSRTGNSLSSDIYQSPIEFSCQKNYIVILTDGAPTRDVDAENRIESLPGFAAATGSSSCDGNGNGACLDDMADYMYNHDMSPASGIQNVTTYTVGFTIDLPILASTAARGGGQYLLADDTASLSSALTGIVLSILDDATTFTAPSVPVNSFNRTQNLQDLFVSVFQPSPSLHWPGNLKKYKLVDGALVGQDSQPAVDPDTGFFSDSAFSFWSASADGKDVEAGGAANELPVYTSRNLYTNISGNNNLTTPGNLVTTGNGALTAAMLGAPNVDRDDVINWARGLDLNDEDDDNDTTDNRHIMGDPLHVQPVTVIYGGTAAAPDATVFVATNDGYVHAIDPDDGTELWAFIPSRMLGRLYDLYLDNPSPAKQYGMDGDFRVYIKNNDFIGGIGGAEEVILIFGQRRGGDAVFALNVTTPATPVLEWIIDSNTAGYSELGQTWSKPQIANVNVNGTKKTVAIIGGGYDSTQDAPAYSTDNIGNAIYMIDIEDGSLVWSAGSTAGHDLVLPDMVNSIPASVNVLNLGQDTYADRMYVGDMGGRLWRFDINNGENVTDLVDGGVLATLGAGGIAGATAVDTRRFYSRPEVVPLQIDGQFVFTINIGSGYRAHPLNTETQDEFYSIRDFIPLAPIMTADYGTPLVQADLVDITLDTEAELDPTDAGWRLKMDFSAGEKILSNSITFDGTIFFTSFSPPGANASDACTPANGLNRLYAINVANGGPAKKPDDPTDPDPQPPEDRYQDLDQGGIAPDPVFFFPPDTDGKPILCIGVECDEPDVGPGGGDTFWVEDETQ